jgi:hypothetical protein
MPQCPGVSRSVSGVPAFVDSQSRPGGIGAANEWCALKTAIYRDSSDPCRKAINDHNTWTLCK